jgi:hypothetical protein
MALDSFRRSRSDSSADLNIYKVSVDELYETLAEIEGLNLLHKANAALQKIIDAFEIWKQKYDAAFAKGRSTFGFRPPYYTLISR